MASAHFGCGVLEVAALRPVKAMNMPQSPDICRQSADSCDQQLHLDEIPSREPLEPLEPCAEGMLRRIIPRLATPNQANREWGSAHGNAGPSSSVSPRGTPSSPSCSYGNLSARFRAERTLLAMAQRAVSWHGPELWLVGIETRQVRMGPSLRDIPQATDRALAVVQQSIGASSALANLLVVHDGWIIGPWVPSEIRLSKEHVVCVTEAVLLENDSAPCQCPPEVLAVLARFARNRLRMNHEQDSETFVDVDDNLDEEGDMESGEEDAWSDDYETENDTTVTLVDFGEEAELERPLPEAEDVVELKDDEENEELENVHDDGRSPPDEKHEVPDDGKGDVTDCHSGPAEGCDRTVDDESETVSSEAAVSSTLTSDAPVTPGQTEHMFSPVSDRMGSNAPGRDHPATAVPSVTSEDGGVIRADQFVEVARNAWLRTKEPQQAAIQHVAIRGQVQRLFSRQEGTDLRNLTANMIDDDAISAKSQNSAQAVTGSAMRTRGRWGQNQQVITPAARSLPHTSSQHAIHGRASAIQRFKPAAEGGPAGLMASTDHLNRLSQLRIRTMHAASVWQTSGVVEALRAVMKQDDPALSMSVLHAAIGRLPSLQAAECAVALALASPLLDDATASQAFPPITTLLRTARETVRSGGNEANSTGSAATFTAARASLLRETRLIATRLEELRVPAKGHSGGLRGAPTFEEQFSFGQGLALAREAAREAWRALNSEDEAAHPNNRPITACPVEVPMTGSAAAPGLRPAPAQVSGRRAW